jgi:hypothetical protein
MKTVTTRQWKVMWVHRMENVHMETSQNAPMTMYQLETGAVLAARRAELFRTTTKTRLIREKERTRALEEYGTTPDLRWMPLDLIQVLGAVPPAVTIFPLVSVCDSSAACRHIRIRQSYSFSCIVGRQAWCRRISSEPLSFRGH